MKTNHIFILKLSFLICMLISNLTIANDTFVYDNGHAAYPINTDKIRMVSEKITVIMDGNKTSRVANVTCEFLFENTTHQEVKAKIGFPSKDRYYYDIVEGEQEKPPLWDFVSLIDGKTAKVAIRKQEENTEWKGIYWYTWDVTFPPSKRITLKNTYSAPLSLSYYNQWFTYILKTGANWKGPIERSEVKVVYKNSADLRRRVVNASPNNFKIDSNKILWEFNNFIPTEDISVYEKNVSENYNLLDERFWNELTDILNTKKYDGNTRKYDENDLNIASNKRLMEIVERMKAYYVGNVNTEKQFINEVNRNYLRILRNEIFARHGRSFKSEGLNIFFKNRIKWYKNVSSYSDEVLNEYEKKNINAILEYEKKLEMYYLKKYGQT